MKAWRCLKVLCSSAFFPNMLCSLPAGGTGGADCFVWAQHPRVHHAAGSTAQNFPGRRHQAAAQPPEEHEQHQQQCGQ